ncbi:MAG: rod shape-determining protein MreC [Candidatus Aminicenantia bacterium]
MPFVLTIRKKLAVLIILLLVHLIIISIQVPLGKEVSLFLKKSIFSIFSPIQNGIYSVQKSIKGSWEKYIYLRNVYQEHEKLKKEVFSLRQQNIFLGRELKKLKKERMIKRLRPGDDFLIAQVIGIDSFNIYRSLVVNKGSKEGVKRNFPVLDEKGYLVGKTVMPISKSEATVQLITDIDSGVGIISAHTKAIGVLTGDLNGKCYFKYVYLTGEIKEGEEVLTSGFDFVYPPGIKVGKVIRIESGRSLFKEIEVLPYFRLNDLENVVILITGSEDYLSQ